jgi:zinc transporter ZupT
LIPPSAPRCTRWRERSLSNLKEAHLDSSAWASAYRSSLAHKAEPQHDESAAAGRGVGLAIIFGNILDTIPGCLVIGAKFAGFESMSATLMVGMFLGGIPESAASATLLRRAGFSSAKIYGMWSIVIIAGIISAMLGNAFISNTDSIFAVIMQAVAAGAILAMVSHAMIPEAFHKGGSASVLPVVLGFLFALYLALEEANLKVPDQTSIGRYKLRNGTSEITHSHAPLEHESMLVVIPPQRSTTLPP